MVISRRWMLAATSAFLATGASRSWAADQLTVAFAGSMGVVMDKGLGPAYQAKTGTQFRGIGQASLGLAHLLAAKTLSADVFVPVSAAPMKIVEKAGLTTSAVPVAGTEMVLAYAPQSRYASAFASATGEAWTKILIDPSLRFGRTDPNTDPQGQYTLFALQLASLYYKQPGFADKVSGLIANPAQIFAEPALVARLQIGQIDAILGYKSAVASMHLPYIDLPAEVNMSDPSKAAWYKQALLVITSNGVIKTVHPSPLVFYAGILKNAANPQAAQSFLAFMLSPAGQAIFAKYGYDAPAGPKI